MENNFLNDLKIQTDAKHQEAHKLKFFQSLINKQLPLESYLSQLYLLSIAWAALERELLALGFIPERYVNKLTLLQNDIHFLENSTPKVSKSALNQALSMADEIMLLKEKSPVALLGYLYTLEGSLQGGDAVLQMIQKSFNLQGKDGTSYLEAYDSSLKEVWTAIKEFINSKADSLEKQQLIIKSSNDCFEHLIKMYESIDTTDEGSVFHSSLLNPEAGEHDVVQTTELILACIEASRECWYEFPYFQLRYGERGYRFGLSDALWLGTLYTLDKDAQNNQFEWLANLLSERGMPTIIFEKQLEILQNKFDHTSVKTDAYTNAILMMKEKRLKILTKEKFEEYSNSFNALLSYDTTIKMRNAGKLMVSAIIDEKMGSKNAVDSYVDWLLEFDTLLSKDKVASFLKNVTT